MRIQLLISHVKSTGIFYEIDKQIVEEKIIIVHSVCELLNSAGVATKNSGARIFQPMQSSDE